MTYIMLQQYLADCLLHGWKTSFSGLRAYKAQIKSGELRQ